MSQADGSATSSTPDAASASLDGAAAWAQARRSPLLVVLSGPSGVGKTTITNALVKGGWPGHVLVTVTTRKPRDYEVDGTHYHFCTVEQFKGMLDRGDLLEHAEVHGNWYGIPATPVREKLAAGVDVILTIDVQGAQTIREKTRGAVFVFIAPESFDELDVRVTLRGQEKPEAKMLRLLNAEREMAELPKYDYLIINRRDHQHDSVAQLRAIIMAEHCRINGRRPEV